MGRDRGRADLARAVGVEGVEDRVDRLDLRPLHLAAPPITVLPRCGMRGVKRRGGGGTESPPGRSGSA